jgi:tetrahydromethanopterin S-methyltransferase subunit D
MATGTLVRLAAPFLVANTLGTAYTVGGSKKARVKELLLMNDHSAAVNLDMHIVPSGGSASATNKMFKGAQPNGLYLQPGESKIIQLDTVMETGEFIQFIANVDAKVSGRLSGMEITGTTLYKRLWVPTLITTSATVLYTVPGATKARIRQVLLMNDHSAVVTVDLHLVPSGGSPSATNKMFKGSTPYGLYLKDGETKILEIDEILEAGESVQLIASTTNKISCRGSGLEVAA